MRRQMLAAAVVFGLAGWLAAWLVYRIGDLQGGDGKAISTPMAGVAAFIVGGLLWYPLALKQAAAVSVWRGALVGALIGFLSHPVLWYLSIVYSWAFLEHGVGGPRLTPISGLLVAWVFSVFSWLYFGWITVPVGAVAGGLLALWPKLPFTAPSRAE